MQAPKTLDMVQTIRNSKIAKLIGYELAKSICLTTYKYIWVLSLLYRIAMKKIVLSRKTIKI